MQETPEAHSVEAANWSSFQKTTNLKTLKNLKESTKQEDMFKRAELMEGLIFHALLGTLPTKGTKFYPTLSR